MTPAAPEQVSLWARGMVALLAVERCVLVTDAALQAVGALAVEQPEYWRAALDGEPQRVEFRADGGLSITREPEGNWRRVTVYPNGWGCRVNERAETVLSAFAREPLPDVGSLPSVEMLRLFGIEAVER